MMPKNQEGQRVPSVSFPTRIGTEWNKVTSDELFANKTVVVFALPGAFTRICSASHVPRYNELQPAFEKAGVDAVVCMAVNDSFVMNAWQQDQGADRLTFVADGNGEFAEKMGMLVDKKDVGYGKRSWRYSMLVRDGKIEKMFIEPESGGDPFDVSDADTMLDYLGGKAPPAVLLFTNPHCNFCTRAKAMLHEHRIPFQEVDATPGMLMAVSNTRSTPQVFVDGEHIGGTAELQDYLSR